MEIEVIKNMILLLINLTQLGGLSIGVKKPFDLFEFVTEIVKNTISQTFHPEIFTDPPSVCVTQKHYIIEPSELSQFCARWENLKPSIRLLLMTPSLAKKSKFALIGEFLPEDGIQFCWSVLTIFKEPKLCAYTYELSIVQLSYHICFYFKWGTFSADLGCFQGKLGASGITLDHFPSTEFPKSLQPSFWLGKEIYVKMDNKKIQLIPLDELKLLNILLHLKAKETLKRKRKKIALTLYRNYSIKYNLPSIPHICPSPAPGKEYCLANQEIIKILNNKYSDLFKDTYFIPQF